MNQVTVKQPTQNLHDLEGSIWVDEAGESFIFAQVDHNEFCLISLQDGNRNDNPSGDLRTITPGHTLLFKSANIAITER